MERTSKEEKDSTMGEGQLNEGRNPTGGRTTKGELIKGRKTVKWVRTPKDVKGS